ncbi:MAG TPA: OsmC family protein [Vicinamibacterales bacterium]|nr:OsmC family protein [Vicinamibacterales bacterium]
MADAKPPVKLELIWEHDLVFAGQSGDVRMTLDSASVEGPSPMQSLAFSLAACMAMDLVHILKKGRHEFRGLRADLTGARAPADPRRFTEIALHYTITGVVPEAVVERGIDLSREKYCSVWHSMRQDLGFTITFTISPGV